MIHALMLTACLLGVDHNLIGPAPVAASTPSTQLLVWHADWCGPCQQMAPAVVRLQSEGYPVLWCDADDLPGLATAWQVEQLPTTILVRNRVEQRRWVGLLTYEFLQSVVRPVKRAARIAVARPSCPPGGCSNCPAATQSSRGVQ